jgi:hypothetical protein
MLLQLSVKLADSTTIFTQDHYWNLFTVCRRLRKLNQWAILGSVNVG